MLHEFRVRNYRCFREEAVIDMRLPAEAEEDHRSFVAPSGTRLMKAMAIVGPNASGKSVLIEALHIISVFISGRHTLRPDVPMPFEQHMFGDGREVAFRVVFELNERVFHYLLTATEDIVIEEALFELNLNSKRLNYCFKRQFNPAYDGDIADDAYEVSYRKMDGFKMDRRKHRPQLRWNGSLIPELEKCNSTLFQEITAYFHQLETNMTYMTLGLGRDSGNLISENMLGDRLEKDKDLLHGVSQHMKQMETGIHEITIRHVELSPEGQEQLGCKTKPFLQTVHRHEGQSKEISLHRESQGTRSMLALLTNLVPILMNGGLGLFDELEAELHPRLFESLLNLILEPQHNPHNAQVIFTTHQPQVINILDRYGITFTDKPDGVFSEAWRMDKINGLNRLGPNLSQKYLAGAFGAIPTGGW